MLFNTANVRAAATGFRAIYSEGFEAAKPLHPEWVLEIASTHEQETFEIPTGFGEMREWVGDREIKPHVRWSQTIRNKDWEGTLEVPRNAYEDDALGVYEANARMMGMSARSHPDELLFETLVGGFTTACYDGVSFFSASHPISGGSTQSNLVSGALSSTTFRTAVANLDKVKNYHGKPVRTRAFAPRRVLMVGPDLRATADSIVTVDTLASGASNPDYKQAEVLVNEYFTGDYANYWFVGAVGGPVRPLILQVRKRPELVQLTDPTGEEMFLRKRVLHGVDGRWNMGYGFYQTIQGSTGS